MTATRAPQEKERQAGSATAPARVSRRGVALLALTGIAGLALAIHGWSARSGANLPGSIAGTTRHVPGSHRPATAPPSGSASRPIGPTASPQATQSPSPSASSSVGPALASQSYAQYAFQVWPGTPTSAGKAALIGLLVSVRRTANGISVTAGVVGQHATPHVYVGGTKVWVIEASLGDDSGNTDYNLGDDGLIVTNAAGRILQ